ncbi:leucyl aminopeptidase [Haloechinothrix alba]|uniref:Probable cytosol aminopeptidase n=1 Tax=Haloechinothrix alba TaxID=664784 RepID=A0A238VXY6_9PSEU|nr:leucyl aminopeptidase [Haloechinothrix alba]
MDPNDEVTAHGRGGVSVPRTGVPSIPRELPSVEVVASGTGDEPLAVLVSREAVDSAGRTGREQLAAAEHRRPAELMARLGAKGSAGELRRVDEPAPQARWLVGTGDGSGADYREAGAALIRAVGSDAEACTGSGGQASEVVRVALPPDMEPDAVDDLVYGLALGGYRYRVGSANQDMPVRGVRLVVPEGSQESAYRPAVARASELAAATALARDLANTPSNVKNPAWLARVARDLADDRVGLDVRVRDEGWLAEHGFGGILAVGGGSASAPRLIELSYDPGVGGAHVLLVGKGITFDTGGLSIKPADGMHLMRTDMSGGAAVLAAMRAIATLGIATRVTALVPAAENHVSGAAYRPGDVVRHYGGRTSEITNTDAEGRIVLADALAYGIERAAPDAVVDVATLTGAMKVSLGVRTGGVFASETSLAERVCAAGQRVGEAWWTMPLLDDHAESVVSEIADLRQAPQGPGGVTAALFLREFAGDLPWAHLDIAGPARAESTYREVVPGGTGFAARTLVELVAGYA